eukprot:COSAG05_NODE_9181_length_642_cov_0.801105_1_plen_101_part_00
MTFRVRFRGQVRHRRPLTQRCAQDRTNSAEAVAPRCTILISDLPQDWSSALYKALEHAQHTLQTKIEELHVQRSRLGAHDETVKGNIHNMNSSAGKTCYL